MSATATRLAQICEPAAEHKSPFEVVVVQFRPNPQSVQLIPLGVIVQGLNNAANMRLVEREQLSHIVGRLWGLVGMASLDEAFRAADSDLMHNLALHRKAKDFQSVNPVLSFDYAGRIWSGCAVEAASRATSIHCVLR